MNELISVILPVYNGDKYLKEAIESILNQSYKNFEFIIINDGSSDDSIEIIKMYSKIDDRIKIINRENRGLIESLNEGIRKSKGSFIARMDQDDISLSTRFELQLNYMLENDLDICGGNFFTIDEKNNILRKNIVPNTQDEILITMASNVPFAHPSVIIRKDFLIKKNLEYGLNGYRNGEDLDLWILMYNSDAKFGNINEMILKYRILSNSMSRENHKRIKAESNIQFNNFIKLNVLDFENSFKNLLSHKINSDNMEKNIIRAVLRYSLLTHNSNILFNCFIRLKLSNIVIGFLSFIKLRFISI